MAAESVNHQVYVATSSIHGRGLFAALALREGDLIGVYAGPQVAEDGPHVLWIEDPESGQWVGYDGVNEMRFMNHSGRPNAEMDGLYCYALREISPGVEITIDYGWEDS